MYWLWGSQNSSFQLEKSYWIKTFTLEIDMQIMSWCLENPTFYSCPYQISSQRQIFVVWIESKSLLYYWVNYIYSVQFSNKQYFKIWCLLAVLCFVTGSQKFIFLQIYGQILHQVWFSISVLDVDEQVRPFFGRTNQGLYQCNGCGDVKTAHSNLRNHIEAKHLHLKLICKFCRSIFRTRLNFQMHLKIHMSQDNQLARMNMKNILQYCAME